MTPSVWVILGPVIVFAALGALIGAAFAIGSGGETWLGLGWGGLAGMLSGFYVAITAVVRALYPEKYYAYNLMSAKTETTNEPQVLAIDLTLADNEHRWIDCGLYAKQWREIAEAIHAAGKYTTAIFENIFGQNEGREYYHRLAAQLSDPDVGILVKAGNGYAVTEGRGEYFFERMATQKYPYPTRPHIMKLVENTLHTRTHAREME